MATKSKKKKEPAVVRFEKPLVVVGLDLSFSGTGWCRANDENDFKYGRVTGGQASVRQAVLVRKEVIQWLSGIDRCMVFLEDFPAKAFQHAHQMGGLQYVVRAALEEFEIPYLPVNPMHLKKFAAGSGKADKEIIIKEVYRRWLQKRDMDCNDNNEADAIVLAHIGMALSGMYQVTTEPQRQVLQEITKTVIFDDAAQAA